MGFSANQARMLSLISRKSDLELEAQFIEQHKLYLANMTNGFFDMQAKLDPDSQAAKILDARIKQLQQADKVLDLHLRRLSTQREAVQKEIESTDKVISKNIETSFGLMGR
jgi:hypothetical protein